MRPEGFEPLTHGNGCGDEKEKALKRAFLIYRFVA
jgi:hypothetical protein